MLMVGQLSTVCCAMRHARTNAANVLSGLCSKVLLRSVRNVVKVLLVTASGSIPLAEQNRIKRDSPIFSGRDFNRLHSAFHLVV